MKSLFKTALLFALTLSIFVSCKDNGNDDDPFEEIAGLWQLDSDEGDILYIDITPDEVTSYDYLGDEYDEGDDCYLVETSEILEVDGDTFTIEAPEFEGGQLEVTITVVSGKLNVTITFLGEELTDTYTRSSAQTGSFTPVCEETAQTKSRLKKSVLF